MKLVKRAVIPGGLGGEPHRGWLPDGASPPRPTPMHDITLEIQAESNGAGYSLYYESTDGTRHGDTWHETLEDALAAAAEGFGVTSEQWEDVP